MGRKVTKAAAKHEINPWAAEARQGRLKSIGGSDFDAFNNATANQAIRSLWLAHADDDEKD